MKYQVISKSLFSAVVMFSVENKWVDVLGEKFESNLFSFDFSDDKVQILNYMKDNFFNLENGVYKALIHGVFEYYKVGDNEIASEYEIYSVNTYKLLEDEKNDYLSQLEDYQLNLDFYEQKMEELESLREQVREEHQHSIDIENQRDNTNQY
jgi:hypothetical protein